MPNRAKQYRPHATAKPTRPAGPKRASREERGYDWRWRRASKVFLRANPVCVECRSRGRAEAATCVDHIRPHKGDQELFWDQENWQSLCFRCHNRKSAVE